VLRSAGYFDQALKLAKKNNKEMWVVKIQVEDLQSWLDCVAYISTLEKDDIVGICQRYGVNIVSAVPAEMTDVLVGICQQEDVYAESFIHLFVNESSCCIEFLQRVLKSFGIVFQSRDKGKNKATDSPEIKLSPRQIVSCRKICDTLLELYLMDSTNYVTALELLSHEKVVYDVDQALVLSRQRKFMDGITFLYEKLGM
jgi:hypothetical protein